MIPFDGGEQVSSGDAAVLGAAGAMLSVPADGGPEVARGDPEANAIQCLTQLRTSPGSTG